MGPVGLLKDRALGGLQDIIEGTEIGPVGLCTLKGVCLFSHTDCGRLGRKAESPKTCLMSTAANGGRHHEWRKVRKNCRHAHSLPGGARERWVPPYYVRPNRGLHNKLKIRLYHAIVQRILLYGAETWPMTRANKKIGGYMAEEDITYLIEK